jgi:DNA repair protein RecN (Recombination protein N)
MLQELHISNLAVIAEARVELHSGLNCFTGATGAGKSLVIGAIELLLGLRSGSDMLRAGADEARITGRFQLGIDAAAGRSSGAADHDADTRLTEIARLTDLPLEDDGGEIVLTRRLHASGRSSATLNGNPITLGMLKLIGEQLVDVHGQHDAQFLLKPSNQLDLLDRFASATPLRQAYHNVWLELTETRRRLEQLTTGEKLRSQQLDLLRFQADEIDRAEPDPDEFRELESRATLLTNLDRLRRESSAAFAALYDADDSILDRLKHTTALLADLATLDPGLASVVEQIRNGLIQLEEASFDLGRYTRRLDLDPSELAEVQERLNTLNRLLRKYGPSIDDVVAFRQQIGMQIRQLESSANDASELTRRLIPLEKALMNLGRQLNESRTRAAEILAPRIDAQLADLGMERARFSVQITSTDEPSPSGIDTVEFLIQTNPGLPTAPLRKIASGGETGRIMLAIKTVLSQSQHARDSSVAACVLPASSVLVFDEIDANIGGRLGSIIGRKLRDLSRGQQVLCITHLPQIAAFADHHLTVRKVQFGQSTTTSVRMIDAEDRIEELAEMIGGSRITDTTRAQARELVQEAASIARPGRLSAATAEPTTLNQKRRLPTVKPLDQPITQPTDATTGDIKGKTPYKTKEKAVAPPTAKIIPTSDQRSNPPARSIPKGRPQAPQSPARRTRRNCA